MTQEDKELLLKDLCARLPYGDDEYVMPNYKTIDWLNAHHFDYRGLIKKGLAIAVTEENNPYKE